MNFTNIECIACEELNAENAQLRRSIYIEFANTTSMQKLYSDFISKFTTYIGENFLPCNYENDILYTFFKEDKIVSTLKHINKADLQLHVYFNPLFPMIRIADKFKSSGQVITKLQKIGYQHLNILSMSDSSESCSTSTSDSDSGAGDTVPLRKKLARCHRAIEVDCEAMLTYHYSNMTEMCGTTAYVNVLIFLDKSVCKQLAKYLGLVYIEQVLVEAQEENIDSLLFKLKNNNLKLYWLIQSYINKKLIAGCHNICLTHTLQLWNTINANVKAVISTNDNKLLYLELKQEANYYVELDKNPSFLNYVEGVTVIVDQVLSCDCHVVAKYRCEDSYYNVKLSLIAIIPFYILQYCAQCEIKEQQHKLKLI